MILIDKTSIVESKDIGDGTVIDEFCVIRKNVILGMGVHVYPHVIISEGSVIGDNTRLYPGTFVGKVPDGAGALARNTHYSNNISIGSDCAIGPNAVIYYDVRIGKNTLLGDGVSVREQCSIGAFDVLGRYVTINYNTTIGDDVKIMDHTWLAGNMSIGDNVFISGGVMTSNDNAMGKNNYSEDFIRGPSIEDNAKIGIGAKILPNVIVGKNSIIGAGSVVTKNVPENAVVMGVPAKIIRYIKDVDGGYK